MLGWHIYDSASATCCCIENVGAAARSPLENRDLLQQERPRDPLRRVLDLRSLSPRPLQYLQSKRKKLSAYRSLLQLSQIYAVIHRKYILSACDVRCVHDLLQLMNIAARLLLEWLSLPVRLCNDVLQLIMTTHELH